MCFSKNVIKLILLTNNGLGLVLEWIIITNKLSIIPVSRYKLRTGLALSKILNALT
jgi:hypothetical protein